MSDTEKPLVYKTPNAESPVTQKTWLQANMSKLIYGIFALVIVLQLIWATKTIIDGRYTASAAPQIQNASFGSVVLTPSQAGVSVNDTVSANIKISTGGHGTDSTDLIIKFNPAVFIKIVCYGMSLCQIVQ